MTPLSHHIDHLAKLARIVSNIDDTKSTDPHHVGDLVLTAILCLEDMKMDLMDLGRLPEIFLRMQWNPEGAGAAESIRQFIEEAHDEIERLLGDQAEQVYFPADEEEACHV